MSDNIPNPEEISSPEPVEPVEFTAGSLPQAPPPWVETPAMSPAPPPPTEIPAMSPPPAAPPPPGGFASNYPRGNQFMFGYIRPPGVYWDSISISVNMIFSNWAVYAASTLMMFIGVAASYVPIMLLLFGTIMATANSGSGSMAPSPLLILPNLLVQFVIGFLAICLTSVGVRQAQGNYPQVSDFFIPFTRLPKSLPAAGLIMAPTAVLTIVVTLAEQLVSRSFTAIVTIGMFSLLAQLLVYVCLVGPLLLSGVAAVFSDYSPIDCVKRTHSVLGTVNWLVFGVLFVVGLIIGWLGFFVCAIGSLLSCPVVTNIIALHYIYCFPPEPPTPEGAPA